MFVGRSEFAGYVPEGTVCELFLGARSLGEITLEPEMIPKIEGVRDDRAFSTRDSAMDEVRGMDRMDEELVLSCRLPK